MADVQTLSCATCGYDLRATPADGVCPECETLVAESKRIAAVPPVSRWNDADPAWRRRVTLGLGLLLALTVVYSVWTIDDVRRFTNDRPMLDRAVWHFNPTLLAGIGAVLLFARERYEIKRPWMTIAPWLAVLVFASAVAHVCVRAGLYGNSLTVIDYRLFGPGEGDELQLAYHRARYSRLYDSASWYAMWLVPLANIACVVAMVQLARHFQSRLLTVAMASTGLLVVMGEAILLTVSFGVVRWDALPAWIEAPALNEDGPPIRFNLLGCGFLPDYATPGEDGLLWWSELLKATMLLTLAACVTAASTTRLWSRKARP